MMDLVTHDAPCVVRWDIWSHGGPRGLRCPQCFMRTGTSCKADGSMMQLAAKVRRNRTKYAAKQPTSLTTLHPLLVLFYIKSAIFDNWTPN